YQAVDRVVALIGLEAVANERVLADDGGAGRFRRAREGDLESALRRFELRPRLRFLPDLWFGFCLLCKGARLRDGDRRNQRCRDKQTPHRRSALVTMTRFGDFTGSQRPLHLPTRL